MDFLNMAINMAMKPEYPPETVEFVRKAIRKTLPAQEVSDDAHVLGISNVEYEALFRALQAIAQVVGIDTSTWTGTQRAFLSSLMTCGVQAARIKNSEVTERKKADAEELNTRWLIISGHLLVKDEPMCANIDAANDLADELAAARADADRYRRLYEAEARKLDKLKGVGDE